MKKHFVYLAFIFIFCFLACNLSFWIGWSKGFIFYRESIKDKIQISKFILPVEKKDILKVSSVQGLRDLLEESYGGSTSGSFHNGIDFAVKDKTKVMAAKSGKAVCVFPSFYNGNKWQGHKIYGGLIILKHGDSTYSLYAHLSRTDIKEGDEIQQGQQIGLSGGIKGRRASGVSTGAHLHFAIYMNIAELLQDFDSLEIETN